MIATITTDASYSSKIRRGTFAFWMVSNEFKITKSGPLRKSIKRPEVAEMQCIINALHILYQQDCKTITRIIINTDCLNAIHVFGDDKKNVKKYSLSNLSFYRQLLLSVSLKSKHRSAVIEFRHVMAHVSKETARNWVNDWCDRNAKEELSKLLEKIKDDDIYKNTIRSTPRHRRLRSRNPFRKQMA